MEHRCPQGDCSLRGSNPRPCNMECILSALRWRKVDIQTHTLSVTVTDRTRVFKWGWIFLLTRLRPLDQTSNTGEIGEFQL
jgi:hypothetical protein